VASIAAGKKLASLERQPQRMEHRVAHGEAMVTAFEDAKLAAALAWSTRATEPTAFWRDAKRLMQLLAQLSGGTGRHALAHEG
jgi:hypothetical protein